jgi:hypothetical protein
MPASLRTRTRKAGRAASKHRYCQCPVAGGVCQHQQRGARHQWQWKRVSAILTAGQQVHLLIGMHRYACAPACAHMHSCMRTRAHINSYEQMPAWTGICQTSHAPGTLLLQPHIASGLTGSFGRCTASGRFCWCQCLADLFAPCSWPRSRYQRGLSKSLLNVLSCTGNVPAGSPAVHRTQHVRHRATSSEPLATKSVQLNAATHGYQCACMCAAGAHRRTSSGRRGAILLWNATPAVMYVSVMQCT